MKRHFVRYILKPDVDINVDTLTGSELDTHFGRVRQILFLAANVDRDPWITTGEKIARIAKEVKMHTELADLFLLIPGEEGDESSLMTDPVIALSLAKRIREYILANRPNA